MIQTEYENRHGKVRFRVMSEVTYIRNVSSGQYPGLQRYDLETAERIAVITENHHVQIVPVREGEQWLCYLVLHDSPSFVAVAEIESMEYVDTTAAREVIEESHRSGSPLARWIIVGDPTPRKDHA